MQMLYKYRNGKPEPQLLVSENFNELDDQIKLQKRIDNGEMLNVGSESNPHWVSKEVWDIVMKVSEKYYPNAKKKEN